MSSICFHFTQVYVVYSPLSACVASNLCNVYVIHLSDLSIDYKKYDSLMIYCVHIHIAF